VIVNLSRDRGLLVVSRQSSFHPQLAQAAPDVIGAQLGVRFLLSGSVRIAGTGSAWWPISHAATTQPDRLVRDL
jgi:TolB-like protein